VSDGIEERLRKLEIAYTEIRATLQVAAGDIKEIKQTIRQLAEIAQEQVKLDSKIVSLQREKEGLSHRIEKLEDEVASLKKIAYGAMALAAVGAPIAMELAKHFLLK